MPETVNCLPSESMRLRSENPPPLRLPPPSDLRPGTRDSVAGEAPPERKFWTFATGADHDDIQPYGLARCTGCTSGCNSNAATSNFG